MVFKNCRDLYVPTQKDIQDILLSEKKQVAEWFLQAHTMGMGLGGQKLVYASM